MTQQFQLPTRIKAARKNAGYKTAKSFLEAHDYPHATYMQYETGRRNPNDTVLKKLAKQFKINFDWLKYGHGSPLKNGKASSVIDGELLDLQTEAVRPHMINEALLTKITEKLFLLAQQDKLSAKRISQGIASIYADIVACEPDPEMQLKMVTPSIATYKRYAL